MTNFLKWTLGNALLKKIHFWKNTPLKIHFWKNRRRKNTFEKSSFSRCSDQGSWGRALENGGVLQLQRSKEGAAHPLAGNQCQPPQTYFVCQLSKPSPGKYSYESWAAKVVKFIKSVGRLVGWTWHSPQRSWRRWPRLMSTCCFSSWLVLTFKESNYRSRSFFRTRCSCLPSKYCFNNPLFKWVFLFSPLCFSAHVGSVQPISFWWATYLLWLVIFQTVLRRYLSAKDNPMCWQSKYM